MGGLLPGYKHRTPDALRGFPPASALVPKIMVSLAWVYKVV